MFNYFSGGNREQNKWRWADVRERWRPLRVRYRQHQTLVQQNVTIFHQRDERVSPILAG